MKIKISFTSSLTIFKKLEIIIYPESLGGIIVSPQTSVANRELELWIVLEKVIFFITTG